MIQTWQTFIVYRTCHDVINCCGPHTLRSKLCCFSSEFLLIGTYYDGKSDEHCQKRCYLHYMLNCTHQHIVWLSLLVAVPCYHVEQITRTLNPPKCTCCMHSCIFGDGFVALSMTIDWFTYMSGLRLKWVGRCNTIASLPLDMAMWSLPNSP